MIVTVTLNPSIDYICGMNGFETGKINRCVYERIMPGGKGINVTRMLKNLGHDSYALGFVAGFTGNEVERLLQQAGCGTDFIHLTAGITRINVKIKGKTETEVNGRGPEPTAEEMEQLCRKTEILHEGDYLVLSGSIPGTMPTDVYTDILERQKDKGVKIVVDATGHALTSCLKYNPFLIKPNHLELGELFGCQLKGRDDVIRHAKLLCSMGAQNVLVSMAGDGAVMVSDDGTVREAGAPQGMVVNSVGAGDSMVAGFVAGYMESGGDLDTAFRMGIAAGSASTFTAQLGSREDVDALMKEIVEE